ncbi:glycosyltransferase [Planctomycetota bacterium]
MGDGPLRITLEQQTREMNLNTHVVFCGSVSDVAPFYDICRFTVLPSRWEGLPVSAVESIALGKPVIATKVGGAPGSYTKWN